MFRLDIGFCPSKCQSRLISSINWHAISIRRLQSTTVRARICSLRIRVQNISDENILVSHSPLKQALTKVRPGLLWSLAAATSRRSAGRSAKEAVIAWRNSDL
jgi:hypothetical protein